MAGSEFIVGGIGDSGSRQIPCVCLHVSACLRAVATIGAKISASLERKRQERLST